MREEHKARFGCRIEIDREAKTFKVFPFIVALGGDSRSNRYEVEEHPGEDDEEKFGIWTEKHLIPGARKL